MIDEWMDLHIGRSHQIITKKPRTGIDHQRYRLDLQFIVSFFKFYCKQRINKYKIQQNCIGICN
jgi:hypothetical protein